jgi:hypothetical protein
MAMGANRPSAADTYRGSGDLSKELFPNYPFDKTWQK